MRAGTRGYVLKGAEQEEMLRAIQAVARGEALFGPATAVESLLPSLWTDSVTAFPDLTEREREVSHLLAQGLSNQEIGERLFISRKTVRNHVSNIFNKLQVADRGQAAIRARDAALG